MGERSSRRARAARSDVGTATAELAVAMPAVALLLSAVAAVGQATVAKVSCLDAARAGARAAARGDTDARVREVALQAAGGGVDTVSIHRGAEVQVRVRRVVRLAFGPRVTLEADATSQAEDIGSVTVLVLAIAMVAALLATATASLGSAIVARHHAQAAADLAALAAASAISSASASSNATADAEPCRAAERIASRNHGLLTDCSVSGNEAVVEAAVRPRGLAGRLGWASARARAGPATAPG